jgi:hypothetical protein
MKKILIILLFIASPLQAEKIEQLSWYNLQELLEDDKLTYKIIRSCVSLNSAVTELIKEEHPDLAKEFFKSANYLYPFGILVLKKIKKINNKEAEKEFLSSVDNLTNDYMDFMVQNGVINQSFIEGTFLGDDLNFCNEIRSAIEITISDFSFLNLGIFDFFFFFLGFLGILDFFVPLTSSSTPASSKASKISVHLVELQK